MDDPAMGIRAGQAIPEFDLVDSQGRGFHKDRLRGKWTFLLFGYTHCPDYCPTTLKTIADAYRSWSERDPALSGRIQVLFVSLDPFRDTPEVLAGYIAYFHQHFIAATGEPAKLKRFAWFMGAEYAFIDPGTGGIMSSAERPDPEKYSVDHSAVLYVFNPRAALYAGLKPPITPDSLDAVFEAMRTGSERVEF
jgi:protein SCO1/2